MVLSSPGFTDKGQSNFRLNLRFCTDSERFWNLKFEIYRLGVHLRNCGKLLAVLPEKSGSQNALIICTPQWHTCTCICKTLPVTRSLCSLVAATFECFSCSSNGWKCSGFIL